MSCTKHRSFGCWQDTNGPIPPSRFGTIQRGVCQTQHSLARYGFHVAHEPRISRPANRTRTHFRSRRPSVEAAHFPARAARVRLTCWLPHGLVLGAKKTGKSIGPKLAPSGLKGKPVT